MRRPYSVSRWSEQVIWTAAISGSLVILSIILSTGAIAERPAPSSSEVIMQAIEREGAAAAVARLKNDPHEWKHVLEQVEQGSTPWLKVGLALRPGTGVGTRHPLDVALYSALPNNPDQVLSWIGHGVSLDDVCSVPRAEWDRAQAHGYLARAKKALKKPLPADIEPIRAQCLRHLDQVMARLQQP